ncbi:elongation factor G, partial [candidate division KSB1 bacterium]
MAEHKTEDIRNIAFIGHGDSGKTTITEAILFSANASKRFGTVEEGTTVSDYNQDEIDRQISIGTSLMNCNWNNRKINALDTPGYMDFTGEVLSALHAVEMAGIAVHAVSGIEVGTEIVWNYCEESNLPRFVIINKMDKEHADFQNVIDSIKTNMSNKVVPVQFPVQEGPTFDSIVDVISMKLYKYKTDRSCGFTKEDIPADLLSKAEDMRNELKEFIAEGDDELLEKYLEEGDITDDEFYGGIKSAIFSNALFPVFCMNALQGAGVNLLLDFVSEYGPNPHDFSPVKAKDGDKDVELAIDPGGKAALQIFKTISEQHVGELSFFKVYSGSVNSGMELMNVNRSVSERLGTIYSMIGNTRNEVAHVEAGDIGAVVKLKGSHTGDSLCEKVAQVTFSEINFPSPVIRVAVAPKSKGDEDKLSTGLSSLHEEDPSFSVKYDPELSQTIFSGLGEMHIDIIIKRLKQKMNVEVELLDPKIPYRETIKSSSKAQGKYKKQSGGRGQYGDAWLEISPQPRGEGFVFEDNIVGGSIPGKYVPAVEKGIVEQMVKGIVAGYKVVDIKASCYDGSFHAVDSSDMAFKIAGSMAFKRAVMDAKPVLLEPIYEVEVKVPEEFMGDVMGDLSGRRGKIQGMDAEGRFQV